MTLTASHQREKHQRETHQVAEPPQDPRAATEVRVLSHVRALTDLFGRRPDLAGVYSPADLTNEAVLWSV